MVQLTDDVLFGDVWKRPGLSPRDRSLVTVAVLAATYRPDQLASLPPRSLVGVLEPGEVSDGLDHGHAKAGGRDRVPAVADDRELQRVTPAGRAGDRPDGQAGSRHDLAHAVPAQPRASPPRD